MIHTYYKIFQKELPNLLKTKKLISQGETTTSQIARDGVT